MSPKRRLNEPATVSDNPATEIEAPFRICLVQNCVRHLDAGVKVENGLLVGIRQHSGHRLQTPKEWARGDRPV